MDICTSITKVDEHATAGDLLDVVINNTTHAYWYHSYADALQFVSKEVEVSFRQDVYKGELKQFINTVVVQEIVNTLDRQDNFKLYCDQEDNFANLSFTEIADGEERQGCIVFCTSQEFKSSSNAVWMELTIRDKMMKTAKLRLFNYVSRDIDFTGRYVMAALARNKYGFRSDVIEPVGGECPPNPEIEIGRRYILNFFQGNPVAMDFINKTKILDNLAEDVDYEKGYGTVRLAMELAMIDAMKNITKDVDLEAIGCALLASRASVHRTSMFSPMVNNIFIAKQFSWENKEITMRLLDDMAEEHPEEYGIMQSVRGTVDALLRIRKGTTFGGN